MKKLFLTIVLSMFLIPSFGNAEIVVPEEKPIEKIAPTDLLGDRLSKIKPGDKVEVSLPAVCANFSAVTNSIK